ncbi:MAG: maleylpyruvate isomerase family mycothiol-dependent enzyme [Anaerolineae bacterium]|nr:maleylpyruvate isomerase family mycothiol-dependent enzyme [Anaerolineae bacterium]
MLEEPKPVIVAALFPEIHEELIALLRSLTADEWQRPTACSGWSVKDVALHLLGDEIGNLSGRRDGHVAGASIGGWNDLVAFINGWNQSWVSVAGRISPRLLIDLLVLAGHQTCQYFQELDPFAMGGAVGWVGPEPAPVWLDLAREYTERWHHQQHIRDAVGKPDLKQPRYLAPVIEAFVRALPRTFRETTAEESTSVTLTITGPSGGRWSVLSEDTAWHLYSGAPDRPDAEVIIDEDVAWRSFTRGMSQNLAREQAVFEGDQTLGLKVLDMVSIIA